MTRDLAPSAAMVRRAVPLLWLIAPAAIAQMSGPPAPVAAKTTPAQQAIAMYRDEHMQHALPPPCRQPKGGEIVVCGSDTRSPYRVPLRE